MCIRDSLYILSGYDLDVDSPYPFPTIEEMREKPKKMDYPILQGEFKFYGKSILQLIEKAIELEAVSYTHLDVYKRQL